MSAILAAAGLAFTVVAILVTVAVIGFFVKLTLKLLLLPLLLIKWLVMSIVMLVVGPILFVAGVILAVVFGLVLAVPLLPFLAVGALVWFLVRGGRPTVAA